MIDITENLQDDIIQSSFYENKNSLHCNCEFPSPNASQDQCNSCGSLLQGHQSQNRTFDAPLIYENEENFKQYFLNTDQELPVLGRTRKKKAIVNFLPYDDVIGNNGYTKIPDVIYQNNRELNSPLRLPEPPNFEFLHQLPLGNLAPRGVIVNDDQNNLNIQRVNLADHLPFRNIEQRELIVNDGQNNKGKTYIYLKISY